MRRDDLLATLCIIAFVIALALLTSGCAGTSFALSYGEGKRTVSARWSLPPELPSTGGLAK